MNDKSQFETEYSKSLFNRQHNTKYFDIPALPAILKTSGFNSRDGVILKMK